MVRRSGRVVVGVDGSPGSQSALDFALGEGASRGVPVEVVTAWMLNPATPMNDHPTDVEAGRGVHQAMQDDLVDAALARLAERPVVTRLVVHDYAGRVLASRAEDAVLLVVGAGSQSASSRKTLGSIAEYAVRHASVPVVVVPEPDRVHRRTWRDPATTTDVRSG